MQECGVLTFTLIFLMDALHDYDEEDETEYIPVRRLYEQKKFAEADIRRIKEYIDQCEKEGVSFNLFDPEKPFMQMWGDPEKDDDMGLASAAELDQAASSGTNVLLTNKKLEKNYRMTPAELITNLCTAMRYQLQCGNGWTSGIFWEPPTYFFAEGNTLYETLILNMLRSPDAELLNGSHEYGLPFYRHMIDVIPGHKLRNGALHTLDEMTYPARRFRAILDGDGRVTTVWKGHGLNPAFEDGSEVKRTIQDPYNAYVSTKKDGVFLHLVCDDDFWSNIKSLITDRTDKARKTYEIKSLRAARELLGKNSFMRVVVYASSNNKAIYTADNRFSFWMPSGLFSEDPDLDANYKEIVLGMIQTAENERMILKYTIDDLRKVALEKRPDEDLPDPKQKDKPTPTKQCLADFSARISIQFFNTISRLGTETDCDLGAEWQKTVCTTAAAVFDAKMNALNMTPKQRIKAIPLRGRLFPKKKEGETV